MQVQTKEGEEATDDQWDFGNLSSCGFILGVEVQVESYCSPQCDGGGGSHEGKALQVRDGNGVIFFDISFGGDYSLGPYVSTIFLHLS